MTEPSHLRASDADRDAVAERLRRAAVEGRLEADELEERLHAALRARTYGELEHLVADLPQPPVAWKPPPVDVRRVAGVALRIVLTLAAVAAVLTFAVVMATWWVVWAVIWFAVRGRGCARWHGHQHVPRRRLAGYR